MLDADLQAQLAQYLQRANRPIELVASLDASPASAELRRLLAQIGAASPLVHWRDDGTAQRRPSFSVRAAGQAQQLEFAAVPLGHEFTSLVLALLWSGGHPPKVDAALLARIAALPLQASFEVYMSLACHSCPEVVQALALIALHNPGVRVQVIDGALFAAEVEARQIMAVPSVWRDGALWASGRMTLEEIVAKLEAQSVSQGAAQPSVARSAASAQAPFDVLIVGGGPAGAAAAVYAARKGVRTGVLAERFGGQVLDTLAIENYISLPATTGPQLAAALEAHTRAYGVPILNGLRAQKLIPADQPGGLIGLELADGARLQARSVILATGARWRNVNVPGEQRYRNHGVAYCPHCDGPLFKGRALAVIGGGNSGVEAAIDLAGLASQVTLIEFDTRLRADAVLQDKLRSLPNVRVIVNAQTTEITGDGHKVTGLRYRDRSSEAQHSLELAGVFVQIGLVPNTEWLADTLARNRMGEIEVDARGQTSLSGVFAAGDCTSVPYKQIIIAAGEGAKAALSAFDHLIRL